MTNQVVSSDTEGKERTFDILNKQDREKLCEAMKEEAEVIKESTRHPITLEEKQRITPEKIEKQIDKFVQFAKKRKEELRLQGVKPSQQGYEHE